MKKTVVLLMVSLLLIAFVGCGSNKWVGVYEGEIYFREVWHGIYLTVELKKSGNFICHEHGANYNSLDGVTGKWEEDEGIIILTCSDGDSVILYENGNDLVYDGYTLTKSN